MHVYDFQSKHNKFYHYHIFQNLKYLISIFILKYAYSSLKLVSTQLHKNNNDHHFINRNLKFVYLKLKRNVF